MAARTPHRLLLAGMGAALLLLLLAPSTDRALVDWLHAWGREGLGRLFAEGAYWAGLGSVQIGAAIIWMVAAKRYQAQAELYHGAAALASVLVAGLLTQVVKHLVGRARPRAALPPWEHFGPSFDSDMHSFPSGHTATSFALAAVLASRFPRWAWLFYLVAALVGLGRVASGSHYPSDVLAGALLGLGVGLVLAGMARRRIGERGL